MLQSDDTQMAAEKSDDAVAIVCPAITKTFDQAIGALQLAKWPRKTALKPHEVRVRVYACALNFFDLLGAVGKYQYKYEPPYVLGSECSGRITEAGAKVRGLKVGDDVCIGMSAGLFASDVVVPATACLPKPTSWTHVQSAAVSVGFLTAYHGLVQRGNLKKGDTLLVTGATGGMGAVACQIGKVVGATVIAGCSSADKCAFAKDVLGADHAIDYSKPGALKEGINALTKGKGVDVVYEVVGGDVFDQCVRVMAWMGRLLVVGFAGGKIPNLPANLALVKSFSLIGVASGAALGRDPKLALDAAQKLDSWTRQNLLPPPPVHAVFPAPQYAAACTAIADRSARGKVVIQFLTEPDAKPTYTAADVKPTPAAPKPKAKL